MSKSGKLNFEIKESGIAGKGVFAKEDIKKGSLICSFKGKEVSIEELKNLYASGKVRFDYPLQIENDKYLLLRKPYLLINHSCSPNSGLNESFNLISIRDIKKGEEITYDYSATEWSDDGLWGVNWKNDWYINCKCKSKNCRGIIGEFYLLSDKLKKKYIREKVVPPFILKKMKLKEKNYNY